MSITSILASSQQRLRICTAMVLPLLFFGYGCRAEELTCVGVPTPGIVLSVVDSVNRRSLDGEATVTVRELDSPFTTSTGPPSEAVRITLRPAQYELKVTAPLYVTAYDTAEVVQQKVDGCEVIVPHTTVVALLRAP